jgi:hypothetical protein
MPAKQKSKVFIVTVGATKTIKIFNFSVYCRTKLKEQLAQFIAAIYQ